MIGILEELDSGMVAVFLEHSRASSYAALSGSIANGTASDTAISRSIGTVRVVTMGRAGRGKSMKLNRELQQWNASHFSVSKTHITISSKNILKCWDWKTEENIWNLEFRDSISAFTVSKKLLLVSIGYIIYGFDLVSLLKNKNDLCNFWTISGDYVTGFIGLDAKHFIVSSKDSDIRFYNRDTIVGECNLSQVVEYLIGIKGWKFIVCTRNYIGIYDKNIILWTRKVDASINCIKYYGGFLYMAQGTKVLVLKESNGHVLHALELSGQVLDVYTNGFKIYILLEDEQLIEFAMDFIKDRNSQNTTTIKKPELQTVEKVQSIDATTLEELPSESKVLYHEKVSITQDYIVILELKSIFTIKKILLESKILKESCFLVERGMEFNIPLDLIWNRRGEICITLAYEFNQTSNIHKSKLQIPKFNQCILYDTLKMPSLVATCIINDFNVLNWIQENFIGFYMYNNCKNSVFGWKLKDGSEFVIEILSKKVYSLD